MARRNTRHDGRQVAASGGWQIERVSAMNEHNPHKSFGLVPRETAAGLSGLEFLRGLLERRLPAPPFAEVTDLWPVSVESGRIVFAAMPSARFYNPMGVVHGGWIATLLDTAMGCAVHSILKPGQVFTTLEMKTVFVRAVFETTGKLTCEGVLLHSGGRVASSEGKMFDGSGRLVAYGSETCLITTMEAPKAPA
jgi:uncharacterized protein (TIGR00369 family)